MRTIEITQSGCTFRMTVESVMFVENCPYNGDHEFLTEDHRKHFCTTSHRVHFSEKMSFVTHPLQARPSASSRPLR